MLSVSFELDTGNQYCSPRFTLYAHFYVDVYIITFVIKKEFHKDISVNSLRELVMMVLVQVDIDIRQLRELNKNAIQKMDEVIEMHPEMAADVKEKLLRASIISYNVSSLYSFYIIT